MSIDPRNIRISDFTYTLPQERIAETPLPARDASKLLCYKNGHIHSDTFQNIAAQLPQQTLLVLNDTKVIEARLLFQKPTGGVIEIFCLEPHRASMEQTLSTQGPVQWHCLIGGASKWKSGQILQKNMEVNGETVTVSAKYAGREEDSFLIEFSWFPSQLSFEQVLHAAGSVPLPPYIKRAVTHEDEQRYQTVFANIPGSVAAPTAALHFTESVLADVRAKNIDLAHLTLHVGAGTFKPVKTETIAGHLMHNEHFTVTKNTLQKIIEAKITVAVGTTSLRSLESMYWLGVKLKHANGTMDWNLGQWEAYSLAEEYPDETVEQVLTGIINWMEENACDSLSCSTSLLIVPGYAFKIPSGLITNFHQPQSTLLLLVAAFIGPDWKKVYAYALDNGYRFLSYGDSSLLWRSGVDSQ